MCGLTGYFDTQGAAPDTDAVRRMNDTLAHRGPDAGDVQPLVAAGGATAVLAHRRLAIIDLDPVANQPLYNEDGTVAVVFNGEIYNFEELRRELVAAGHRFRSRTDTEVIVHGYEVYGDDVVRRLDGMFSFALWDGRRGRLLLARDRAGKKPLYYSWDGRRFTFASEMKALRACPWVDSGVDWSTLPELLRRGFVTSPRTVHTAIRAVPAASVLAVEAGGPLVPRRYWDFPMPAERRHLSWDEATEGVRQHLREAVRRRLVSDVPLGALLSGGLDSSMVVGLMAEVQGDVRTFTAGLVDDPSFDERQHARLVARHFGTTHTEIEVRPNAAELLETIIWHLDQPMADSSAVPTYAISQATRQHVTVALVGDGGDEVFGGYERYRAGIAAEHLPAPAVGWLQRAAALLPSSDGYFSLGTRARRFTASAARPLPERYQAWMALFPDPLIDELLVPGVASGGDDPVGERWHESRGLDPLARMQHADFHTYLHDDLLVKMDRMSMAASLETRSPMLDTALMEYVAGLPAWMKATPFGGKRILRRAAAGLVPPSILRRRKHGFGVPVAKWFQGELVEPFSDLVLAGDSRSGAVLRGEVVRRIFDEHRSGTANHGPRLWSLLVLEGWLRGLEARQPVGRSTW